MHHGAQEPRFHSLSFDHFRGTLFVVDTCTAQLQVYSADDGRLLHRFGSRTVRRNHLGHYVAIDHNRERIFLIDSRSFSIRPFSLQSLHMLTNECRKANGITFGNSRGVTVDRDPRRRRIFICDTKEHRLLGCCSRSATTAPEQVSSSILPESHSIRFEIESRSWTLATIEYKCSRRSMARSCSRSALGARRLVSSRHLKECVSTTIAASSSLIPSTNDCKHSRPRAIISRRTTAFAVRYGP